MTRKEYDDIKKKIEKVYSDNLKNLDHEYAISNNPYKIGDIVEDHADIIKITKIGIERGGSYYNKYPQCFYIGDKLTKKMTQCKNQKEARVYQYNIIKKLS